jgi:hypothetical protein
MCFISLLAGICWGIFQVWKINPNVIIAIACARGPIAKHKAGRFDNGL